MRCLTYCRLAVALVFGLELMQQAAGLLQVSRPHLVKLLEEGLIPFRKVGSHRRLLLRDILSYEAQQKERRLDHLRFLAQQAQELNLGYE